MNTASLIISIVTALTALVALYLSYRQIRISNRQQLFDRRVSLFLTFTGLLELYKELEPELINKGDEPFNILPDFHGLTNNTQLQEAGKIIDDYSNEKNRIIFLSTLEELKKAATASEFIYKDDYKLIKDFILQYVQVLLNMYKYEIRLERAQEHLKTVPGYDKTYNKDIFKEYLDNLYESYENIRKTYNSILNNKLIDKLKSHTKL